MDEALARDVAAGWMAAMRRGDWEAAWRQSDRIELPRRARQGQSGFARGPHHLRWDGTPLAGRRVLVRCEHGLGDTLQFIRFVPIVSRLAREVTVLVQPHLLGLLQGLPGLGSVRNGWSDEPPPPHDVEIEVMELAYALRATPDTLPPPYRQLALNAGGLDFPLRQDGNLKVGLLWAASEWDSSRSIPLAMLEPLWRVKGARFFSLQQGAAAGNPLAPLAGIAPLSRHTGEVTAAAAAMLRLDRIVTVDAMAAHLAGNLGCPTFLLLQHRADWRWMDDRVDSPWYPGMRLYRQPRPSDWEAVGHAVAQALREEVAHRASGALPAQPAVAFSSLTCDQPGFTSATLSEAGATSKRST